MKCTNNITGKVRKLLCFVGIAAVFLTGCGSKNNLENPYYAYQSDYTTSTGNQKFFADPLCVTADINFGTTEVSLSHTAGAAGAFNLTRKEVVYGQNLFERMYPASTTKVLTAYIILRYGNLDDIITVSYEAAHPPADSSVCGLREGDRISVKDLLYGLMLESGNDAAIALAEYYSGSVNAFAAVMNEEARRLGATGSHFVNPSGMPSDSHYTTIYDMYLIYSQAITVDMFCDISGCQSHTAVYENASGGQVTKEWHNTCRYLTGANDLPEDFKLLSAKTGTTNAAKNCLVLCTENPVGEQIISIVYKSESRSDLYTLMNQILNTFAK